MFSYWIMKLAKEGYGDIAAIRNMDIKTFFHLIHYEQFLSDYQRAFRKLNKKG